MSPSESSGRIVAIWIKPARLAAMEPRRSARMVAERGIEGNAHQGGRRQVTLISAEDWAEAEHDLGAEVDPAARRANIMISGLPLAGIRDRVLALGDCRLEILARTRPCGRMDMAHPGLMQALDVGWRCGSYGRVLTGGEIAVGDPVSWGEATEAVSDGG